MLFWTAPKAKKWDDEATKYVVYRFLDNEPLDTDNPSKIITITSSTMLPLPYNGGNKKYVYVVTALDRMSNESRIVKKKVNL